jgi:hypothetical protein
VDHQVVLTDEVDIKTLIFDLSYQLILERIGRQGETGFWGVSISDNNKYFKVDFKVIGVDYRKQVA